MTPLYDAIGFSVTKLRQVLEGKTDYDVLVTILTDGEENSSKEYTGKAISQLINELQLSHWIFTYIGTDHNVEEFAATISITNTMTFQKNEAGMQAMFSKERHTCQKYSQNIREKKDPSQNFYVEDDAKN
jgi:hypothetical protein